MAEQEPRIPNAGEIADIVNAELATHKISPLEYKEFLQDKLKFAHENGYEDAATEAITHLEGLVDLYPYLREDNETLSH